MKTSTTRVTTTITMLLLALSAGVADYAPGIFANANEGEMINMQDVAQIDLTIPGRDRRG